MQTTSTTNSGTDTGERRQANGAARPPRKYVLFADGTGNAFSTQELNVWRLYEALDRTQTDQIAFYIKGVGTAGWPPFAKLDGATGIGVPSNVRKLYRFLCWNWLPGDEIYIFGFSRGAFTARTLAALIASQGLVPPSIGGEPVTHAEMERNAMAAWREYRRHTVPWYKSLPSIWVTRWIRDAALALHHMILRHRTYKQVRAEMDGRKDVSIKFLGLFDTVEAYGVPVEELRTAIDWAIWPISFRNHVLSQKVERARHALALDDERTTFHPLRFDQSKPRDAEQIREVWFTGVHSDVGGGYPDGTLSYVPLVWMAEQVDLRFQPGQIPHFRAYQSALGPMHDSRSGAASFYRYGPRPIGEDTLVDGGPPVVHWSVVERMLHGCDNYAPVMLPASAKVLVPDGRVLPLTDDATRETIKSASAQVTGTAVTMAPPDADMVEQTLDTVWWRRVAYFSLLALVVFAIAWPLSAETVVGWFKGPTDSVHVVGDLSVLGIIRLIDNGIAAVVGSTANLLQSLSPSYLAPWFKIAIFYPFATTLVVLALIAVWNTNSFLRDRIQERARLAWYRPGRKVSNIGKPSVLLKVASWFRRNGRPAQFAFSKLFLPGGFLVLIFALAALALGRSYFNWYAGTGELCQTSPSTVEVSEHGTPAPKPFDTASACWPSGLKVEKGRQYRIWITIQDPWFDRSIFSGANGFDSDNFAHYSALLLRRWVAGASWFQPVVRIGKEGADELVLQEVNGLPADRLPRERESTDGKTKREKLPSRVEQSELFKGRTLKYDSDGKIDPTDLTLAREAWGKQKLTKEMVADFVAPASGEVFLYLNDAVQMFPLLDRIVGPYDLFYRNNSGTARVVLQREPLPPVPPAR